MDFIITGNTDIGTTKVTNQDSLSMKTIRTKQGKMVFAVLCDGMGGLEKGEVASASVVLAFEAWIHEELPVLCEAPIEDYAIREQWCRIVEEQNEKIKAYGASRGVKLGTTVTAMLITQSRYYILNVGDTRAYEIHSGGIKQITNDQTLVAREVAAGNITAEQAKTDPRRSILLQCIGASDAVYPEMFFGDVIPDTVYMLCCDGFRHEVTSEEMFEVLKPEQLMDENAMNWGSQYLIDLNKQRHERDNITVALVRTF